MDRRYGAINFPLTQVLSEHGSFGKYLYQIFRKETSAECHYFGERLENIAQHTLETCSAWAAQRAAMTSEVVDDLSLLTIVKRIIYNTELWQKVRSVCDKTTSQKKTAERNREVIEIRRRRAGQRRNAYALFQPPHQLTAKGGEFGEVHHPSTSKR
ncbi:hypothetical protein EVAR_96692_1 [Eumeta japonica]|uniref:Uncharacterized protein n=1 Tax=Eumeta variegata TaxID=151549 RepID=A0A4C1WG92_EUMVA|nr:hypothetical protein EVAR_96692_1 [Eumeta japonica]